MLIYVQKYSLTKMFIFDIYIYSRKFRLDLVGFWVWVLIQTYTFWYRNQQKKIL